MLYLVDIRRDREHLAQVMSAIREWLEGRRFEPNAFGCETDEQGVSFRLEFKYESEAAAFAEAFHGEVSSPGL